jgi:hypothetical protein
MLKKIRVDEVQLGMHIKEFCGSWMDHPFWRGQFVITDPKDLDKIRASKVREVMIDTDKGIDTPANAAAAPPEPAPTVDEQAEAMEQVVKYDRPAHVPLTKVTSDRTRWWPSRWWTTSPIPSPATAVRSSAWRA